MVTCDICDKQLKTILAVKCELCSYQAKTPQGLAGHKQFKHQLADRSPRPSELAQRVETLESREAELAENIKFWRRQRQNWSRQYRNLEKR